MMRHVHKSWRKYSAWESGTFWLKLEVLICFDTMVLSQNPFLGICHWGWGRSSQQGGSTDHWDDGLIMMVVMVIIVTIIMMTVLLLMMIMVWWCLMKTIVRWWDDDDDDDISQKLASSFWPLPRYFMNSRVVWSLESFETGQTGSLIPNEYNESVKS